MIIVSVSNISKSYPSIDVLKDVRLAIQKGEKIGFIGPNGTGKTTLLEIICGLGSPDSGSIDISSGTTIKYLPQSIAESYDGVKTSGTSIFDFIRTGLDRIDALRDEITELENKIARNEASEIEKLHYSDVLHAFQLHDGYSIDSRVEKVAAGLGFRDEMLSQTVNTLSGGEKNRAAGLGGPFSHGYYCTKMYLLRN